MIQLRTPLTRFVHHCPLGSHSALTAPHVSVIERVGRPADPSHRASARFKVYGSGRVQPHATVSLQRVRLHTEAPLASLGPTCIHRSTMCVCVCVHPKKGWPDGPCVSTRPGCVIAAASCSDFRRGGESAQGAAARVRLTRAARSLGSEWYHARERQRGRLRWAWS